MSKEFLMPPKRRSTDDERYVEMIVDRSVTRFLTTLGINATTPESIIEVQKNWSFLTRSRKIFSYLFTASLLGGLTWLGKQVASVKFWT